ncbi:leukocyte-associated immunoglobulin-like receptor 1 [Kogia breviceps]|uniref:leukocyte-associated immunoglobulin-like receptor 1 n=1 Tax=Kogia breviceps TaxID=27615 RepID=UPI0034D2A808
MSAAPTTLLSLGSPPRRSIRAEPGAVRPQGRPVTVVCRGPAGAEEFRLERKENRSDFQDEKAVSQIAPQQTEARFRLTALSRDAAQQYQCLYRRGDRWSEPSDALELEVTGEEVSAPPSGLPQVPGPCPQLCPPSTGSAAPS